MTQAELHDSIIVGGGIAGLQAAIQLGRYKHNVMVIDSQEGRSTLCQGYHNILGWPDGVSGLELREKGHTHAKKLGVRFHFEEVVDILKKDDFHVYTESGIEKRAKTLLIATGIMDRFPPLPGLVPCFGLSVYVCPDCDGYEVSERLTVVLGSGKVGASMALALTYWTNQLIYINHEQVELEEDMMQKLKHKGIKYVERPVESIRQQDGYIQGVNLEDGTVIECEKGFIAFGKNKVFSDIVKNLGVDVADNRHIDSNPRTKETNVSNAWVAGDIGLHSEQTTIAMGEGSQAAIWMHKSIMKMKKNQQTPTKESIML